MSDAAADAARAGRGRRGPVTVADARDRARRRYARDFGTWAVASSRQAAAKANAGAGAGTDDDGRVPTLLDLPLHPPTEAAALADEAAAISWVRSWQSASADGLRDAVVWGRRRWSSLGAQDVPERLLFTDPAALARFAGRSSHWQTVVSRTRTLSNRWGATEAVIGTLRPHAGAIAELTQADFDRLGAVIEWLVAHPDSGLYLRQLPVRGVDTKWVGTHRGLVTGLFTAITGRDGLGLTRPPGLVRIRFLDPTLRPGRITDLAAPVSELARLDVAPRVVLVFENLESVVAMPDLPGAVVVHGSGYAVDRLAEIPWVRTGRVVYWGDLDSHGFAILNRLRSHLPDVTTVLMDAATLEEYRDLWVDEPTPSTGELTHLLPSEQTVLDLLRAHGNVRLEQERLEWTRCVEVLTAAAGHPAGTAGSLTDPGVPGE